MSMVIFFKGNWENYSIIATQMVFQLHKSLISLSLCTFCKDKDISVFPAAQKSPKTAAFIRVHSTT